MIDFLEEKNPFDYLFTRREKHSSEIYICISICMDFPQIVKLKKKVSYALPLY